MARRLIRPLLVLATAWVASAPAQATCTAEPYLGSVCMTAANFCPRGYLEAAGQLVSIAQNTAVFALLGTTYGGNGQNTFGLPDLRGRAPIGQGQGPGLSGVVQGEVSGAEQVTLTVAQMPAHSHSAQLKGTASAGTTDSPAGAVPAKLARANNYSGGAADAAMGTSALAVGISGGNQPVPIRNPYAVLRYCIAMEGLFPSRP